MQNKVNKKYYSFDKKLTNTKDDFFKHEDLSNNVCDLIENNNYDSSFNIALIGKWGIGKSSLLNFVEKRLKKDGYKNVYTINAWKYEKESIRIVLLKNIINKIDNKKSFITMIVDVIKKLTKNNHKDKSISFKDVGKIIKKSRALVIIMIGVTIISGICKMILSQSGFFGTLSNYGLWKAIVKALDFGIDNFFLNFMLSIVLAMTTDYIGSFIEKVSSPLDITPIINDTCCYEEILDNILEENKDEKYVFILDDIDRLSKEKIVETLDALKILMDRDNLYLIVPFDDSIVKKALEKDNINSLDPDHLIIQSELVLDKLFKFKVYLNPLVPSDIISYTENLIKKDVSDITDFIDNKDIPSLIRILIHKGVTTPRQVKKVINIFMGNVIVLNKRCSEEHKEELLSYRGYKLLAKLSVLQADFNDFYDTLVIHNDNIDRLLEYHENGIEDIEVVRDELRFIFDDKNKKIKKEFIPLLNFLSNTKTINDKNISYYLYLSDSPISLKYSDEMSINILNSIESGNLASTINYINSENRDLSYIIINIMDETNKEYFINVFNVCIELYVKYYSKNNEYANSLSNLINKMYCNGIDITEIKKIETNKIILLYNCVDYRGNEGINKLLYDHINWIIEEKNDQCVKDINLLVNNDGNNNYSNMIIDLLCKGINELVTDENIEIRDVLVGLDLPSKEKINTFFKIDFLKNIKDFYMNNDEKNDKLYENLKSIILANGGTENANICGIIEDLYENETNISTLNSIVLNKEDKHDKL